MQTRTLLFVLGAAAASFASQSCKSTDCGEGTVERDGSCVPADQMVNPATCGPFTMLDGTQCVPMFKPTICDTTTTQEDLDSSTGVTTCVGTGTSTGCSGSIACPTPVAGKQTICGQIYDFETNMEFRATGATGAQCAGTETSGPCALRVDAYDALAFAADPANTPPLASDPAYIDDCGRYRISNITVPANPFVGLGVDDRAAADRGPGGITNAVGTATVKSPGMATKDFENWIVKPSTTTAWAASGGPTIATGFSVSVFRASKIGLVNQAGVTVTRNGGTIPSSDYYFQAAETGRTTIDPAATATGANGTAFITNASPTESLVYSGQSTLPTECRWEQHAAASLVGVVFIQIYRPINQIGMTCTL